MKSMTSFRFIITLLTLVIFAFVFKSCKKVDKAVDAKTTIENAKSIAINAIKEKYGNVSAGIIFNVNKKSDTIFYKNSNGVMVNINGINSSHSPQRINCNSCITTSDPTQLRIVYTLNYVQRFYICESTYASNLLANWTISIPFKLNLIEHPGQDYYNSNTQGNIDITDPSNLITLHYNAPYTEMKATPLGIDPSCSYNTLYSVTYTYKNVPNGMFGNGTSITAALALDNDCSIVGNVVTSGHVSAPATSLNSYLPCNRVDQVYINPPAGGTTYTTASGNYITCSYPGGSFVPIDYHQLEYRLRDSINNDFEHQGSTIYNAVPVGSSIADPKIDPYTGVSYLVQMTHSSGIWLVRYRNVKTSTCPVITILGWGSMETWVTETWVP